MEAGVWWLALKPCAKSSLSWAGYCCTYHTMRLSRTHSKYWWKCLQRAQTLSPDSLLHLSSLHQLKLITSWEFSQNQLMEKEKNPGLDKEWVSLVCWCKLHHCHTWWQSSRTMVREILPMSRYSNIKIGWALYLEGDRTEGRIYRNSWAVAYGLAYQSGSGRCKIGRLETMRSWEEVCG